MSIKADTALPPIPEKRYFTIGEVSGLCAVKPHVLRYWEQEFPQLKPNKRRGNRRYYQRHEVILIRHIRELLYEQGFTIQGARNRLAANHNGSAQEQLALTQDDASLFSTSVQTSSNSVTLPTITASMTVRQSLLRLLDILEEPI